MCAVSYESLYKAFLIIAEGKVKYLLWFLFFLFDGDIICFLILQSKHFNFWYTNVYFSNENPLNICSASDQMCVA